MAENKMDRMRELVSLLNKASEAYYARDQEIMSNFEYDGLYDELAELEKELGVTFADSPTVQVGYEAVDELPKITSAWVDMICEVFDHAGKEYGEQENLHYFGKREE